MQKEKLEPTNPKVKYRSFSYRTRLERLENRTGRLDSNGKPSIRISSPPEFKGESGTWTPEDLLVSAIDACIMTTFVAFAERQKLPIISYHSGAEGLLEYVDGKYRITCVVVRPKVVLGSAEAIGTARDLFRKAHENCVVSNSTLSAVYIEPEIGAEALPRPDPGEDVKAL